MTPAIETAAFHDARTGTVSYVVRDIGSGEAAIIDPVLDYDAESGRTSTSAAERIAGHVRDRSLRVRWILETHVHADHLSAARWLQRQVGGKVAIGERILDVQARVADIYDLGPSFRPDGSQFDHLFRDEESFPLGDSTGKALLGSGHTPADAAFEIEGSLFVGDTLFMPDVGSARADFPGGDARELYRFVRRILSYPADTAVYVCHDYPPTGRGARWQSSVAEQRARNIHLRDGIGEDEFVAMRTARDATLALPALMRPALHVNVRGGALPLDGANG